jgi:hypothetical protein
MVSRDNQWSPYTALKSTRLTENDFAGWNAPRKSLLLVHPDGLGSQVSNKELNISFDPNPDYATIALGASGGKCWGGRASTVEELATKLPEAVEAVQNGHSALLDARIQ